MARSAQDDTVANYGANVVFETRDRGRTWQTISPDLTRNDVSKQRVAGGPINTDVSGAEFYDTLLDIAPSPIDANTLWTGSDDGRIWRTTDGGAHWQNATPANVPPWGRVETIEPSHVSIARAYAVINRHALGDRTPYVLVTNDGGVTWTWLANGLQPDEPAHVLREDARNPDVLFAGFEEGARISFDRGSHWQTLQLNMPPTAVRDMRVVPAADDLIAGTHGRGIYILDDLTPLEGLRAAQAARAPVLFTPRPAYAWYLWWSGQYGTHDDECCVPSGTFSGTDAPYGALLSYYLPARTTASIEIIDAAGATVARFDAPGDSGLNRIAWGLRGNSVVEWNAARDWNKSWDAPIVVPGTYTVRLHAGSQVTAQRLEVRPDPRAHWTQAQYVARYQFLSALDAELSSIDTALNHLDALRARVSPPARRALESVYDQLTSGVVNSEDDQWRADKLRERLTNLLGVVNLSQGPPLPPHLREAAEIHDDFERAMTAYRTFIEAYHL
ncbi:MAG: hypothetical protein JOZ01_04120 [Candidatus Eremiobacteraeota bacterium]|nr:hypothetical protein [Candidatus Eremiobacteraeota bacterium]